MNPNDRQVGGDHYKTGYPPWDLFEDYGIGYMECNVIKYVQRWRNKGKPEEDTGKADHYLDKLIDLHTNRGRMAKANVPIAVINRFAKENGLTPTERAIVQNMAKWSEMTGLHAAKVQIADLMAEAYDLVHPEITMAEGLGLTKGASCQPSDHG